MRLLRVVLGALATMCASTATQTFASIPDSSGVYYACYSTDGSLRLIDPAVIRSCPRNWKGPAQWHDKASFDALVATVTAEIARAKAAEADLAGKISSEASQRVAADETLGTSISSEA